jgi:2-polyprenyl-6-methoxyphenol hydroxylase-like FAD-dependent oxidoreductase
MLLARRGLKVLVIDRASAGTDTVSTHALMRGAVVQLHRWGVLDEVAEAGTPAIRGTTFWYGDEELPLRIKPKAGVDALYAPRRTVIDPILADAARRAGAEVRYETRLIDLRRSADGRVEGVVIENADGEVEELWADIVIGADGRKSSVARLVQAPVETQALNASAVIFGYFPDIGTDAYEWYYAPGLGAGIIPTNDGDSCVFMAMPRERLDRARGRLEAAFHELLAECNPGLGARLAGLAPSTRLRSFVGAPGFLRQATGPGWALVGDAGYFKDPLTAHGITDAFRDAELLARAVGVGTPQALADYQQIRDGLSRRFFEISDLVGSFAWDLDLLKGLHLTMNEDMKREVDFLLALDDGFVKAA